MADPISAGLFGVGGLLGSFFGGNQQQNYYNSAINNSLGAGNDLLNFINGSTFGPGFSTNQYNNATNPLLEFGQGILGGNWAPDYLRQQLVSNQNGLNQFGQYQLPGLMNPSDPAQNGFFQNNYMPQVDAYNTRANQGIDAGMGAFGSYGWNPNGQNINDYSSGMMQGNNPYMQNTQDVGQYMFANGGQNSYNTSAMDQSLYNIGNQGYNGNISSAYNMFGGQAQNPYTQQIMGGMQQGSGLMSGGAQMAGQYAPQGMSMGQNLMSQGAGNIGYGQQMSSGAAGGMGQFLNGNPEQYLGARGSAALDSLAASPYIGQGFGASMNALGQGTANMGMSPQAGYNWSQSAPRAFGSVDQSNTQMNDAWNLSMNAASGGGNDVLPEWFYQFSQNAPGLSGAGGFGGGGGGSFISSGGGGGGASAGAMSRDLGPVDPQVQAAIDQSLELFNKDPLISMNQAVSFARDRAATSGRQQADAVARRAANLGGQGPIGFGGQNQAYADFADQAMANEAGAVREAVLGQQGLGLQRTGQAAQLAQAMQAAKSQREGIFGNMNIADAGNQTQASIANSNAAESAAGRAMQASMANAQNQQAMAQLQASVYNNLLNNATNLRGQNVSQTLQGMQNLPALQNSMTERQGMLFNNMNNAQNTAAQQYLGTLGTTLPNMNSLAQTDISRWNSLINPLVAGQQTGTDRANTLGNLANTGAAWGNIGANQQGSGASLTGNVIGSQSQAGASLAGTGANLYGNMQNSSDNRYNTASNGLIGSMGAANTNFGNNVNLWNAGATNALGNATLGNNAVNNVQQNMLGWGNLGAQNNASNLNYGVNSGNTALGFLNGQNNANNSAMGNYLGIGGMNQQNNMNAFNMYSGYNGMQNSAFNPLLATLGAGTGALSGVSNQMAGYNQAAMGLLPNYLQSRQWQPFTPVNGLQTAGNMAGGFVGTFPNVKWN